LAREVFVDDLFLQRDGRRGDHQTLARRLGRGNRRDGVRHRLAGAGARFHCHHRRVARTTAFLVGVDVAQYLGDFGDHQTLAVARFQAFGFKETRVGALNLGFEFGADHRATVFARALKQVLTGVMRHITLKNCWIYRQ
jgi:hypothetical protein